MTPNPDPPRGLSMFATLNPVPAHRLHRRPVRRAPRRHGRPPAQDVGDRNPLHRGLRSPSETRPGALGRPPDAGNEDETMLDLPHPTPETP